MNKTLIIAEAGVNHNGDIKMAYQLIDAAAEAKVDYVKFQTYKTEHLVSVDAEKAEYQKENSGAGETQFEMLKRLELPYHEHQPLKQYAEAKGIKFLSTGFDDESLDFLNQLGIDFYKIPSGEAVNYLYLKKVASLGKSVILSTGMCTYEEVEWSVNALVQFGVKKENITVLHCNSEYPSPYEDLNLKVIPELAKQLGVKTGYSDHSMGIEVSVAAVALGATVIEKHFTLDRNLPGPDHLASLEPNELKQMVEQIRHVEVALGNNQKTRSASEEKNIVPARKGLYFKTAIKAGTVLTVEHLLVRRPCQFVSAKDVERFIGKTIKQDVAKDQPLKEEHFA